MLYLQDNDNGSENIMGDRRNIVLDNGTEAQIALYTHWSGSNLPETLGKALLRGQDRWGDGTYLSRIIFSEMVKGDIEGSTGYGIEAFVKGTDNYCEASPGYDIIVDLTEQQVGVEGTWLSFPEFIRQNVV